jgi:hypothetical protein
MTHHTPEFTKGDSREHWSDTDRERVLTEEKRAVLVEGYIDSIEQEDDGDTHLWIGAKNAGKPDHFIAEVTPHFRHQHADWQYLYFRELANSRIPVRIGGWLLWDELHPEELAVSRATLWEVHPVTRFEKKIGGDWVAIE